jgi:hypothetical protein
MPDRGFAYAGLRAEQRLAIPVSPSRKAWAAIRRSFAGSRNMFDIADGWVWALVIVGGPLLIGIFMAVFSIRRRRLSQTERKISDQAAHENWGKERVR